jgi:soluble lytic murein transglycosylase-like protein
MNSRATIVAAIVLTMLGLSPPRAHAQIAFYTDSNGQRVYINGNAPAPPKHASESAHTASPAPPTATPSAPSAEPTADPSSSSSSTPSDTESAAAPAASAADQPAADHPTLDQMVNEVATRYNVDPQLVRAVIGAESNWNPQAVSRTGAQGLMQLVPTTARQLGVRNAFDPRQNIEGGVSYLKMLLERYDGDLDKALAAYNAGPGAVDRAGGVPPIAETRQYVQRVTETYYNPAADRSPGGPLQARRPIYRTTDDSGRIVFTNE